MLRITNCPTKNKNQPPTMQHSVAMAIATATTTVAASTRITVAGKGTVDGGRGGKAGRGRPRLDSKLVHQPYNHTTFTTFITTTTTAAAAVTSAACTKPTITRTPTTKTFKSVHINNQLENSSFADIPAPAAEAGGRRPGPNSKLVQYPLRRATLISAASPITTAAVLTSTLITTTTAAATATEESETVHGENQLEKIPLDVLLDIALLIPSCQDFTNLLLTCKYVYQGLNTHWLRHQRFLLRFGRVLLLSLLNPRDPNTLKLLSGGTEEVEDALVASKEDLAKWYSKHSRMAVQPEEMGISHRNTGYWKFVNDSRSPYGKVARLIAGLAWLDVSANMHGVKPGRYWVQWGFGMKNSSSVVGTQFRVTTFPRDEIPIWHNETPESINYTPQSFRQFLHHTDATNKDVVNPNQAIIFQLPQVLAVEEDKPTVFLQMREHDQSKSGITVLFVRLIPVGEEEEEDAKAERENVEGELDAVVEIGENPWEDEYGHVYDNEDSYGEEYDEEEDGFGWGLHDAENGNTAGYGTEYGEEEGGFHFPDIYDEGEEYDGEYEDEDDDGYEDEDERDEVGSYAGGGLPLFLLDGDEDADNEAGPYFLRNSHH